MSNPRTRTQPIATAKKKNKEEVRITLTAPDGKKQKYSVSPGHRFSVSVSSILENPQINTTASHSSQEDEGDAIIFPQEQGNRDHTVIQIEQDDNDGTHTELDPSPSTLSNKRNKARKQAAKARRHAEKNEKSSLIPDLESPSLSIQIDDEQSEQETEQTWGEWFVGGLSSGAQALKDSALYAVKHPVTSVLSLVTAAPPTLNALVMPSGKSPDQIGSAWWNEMSPLKQTHSIANAGSSFAINAIMNAFFIPTAWDTFKSRITHTFDSPKEFIDNNLSIILGLGGAVAAAAIAYNAFLWMPVGNISAGAPAAISFLVTLASRYIGVKNVFKRIHNFFSDDAKAQADFADALAHINQKHLAELQITFDKIMDTLFADRGDNELDQALTNEDYDTLSKELAKELTKLAYQHPDLIDDKTTAEYIAKYSAIIFDLSFAFFMCGVPAGLTFMQKGFDGVNTLAKFAGNDLTSINPWLQRLIGLTPGLASGMLYMDSGTKIRNTLYELAEYLYENPKSIPFALAALTANGLGTSGPQNVAAGVLANHHNIIGISQNESFGTAFVILNALAGGVVNTNASINKAFLASDKDPVHVTEHDLIKYLSKVNDHMVSHKTADKFRTFLAATNRQTTENDTTVDPQSILVI